MTTTTAETIADNVRTASGPSALRITDLRIATILGHGYYPILRIDTNQGVYGLGEVRDGASPDTALRLKHLLLGQNPCNVDYLFKMISRYGGDSREAGGVCGIEIALMDLVGKVYGIPCYQLLGGKYRDRVRLYGDTPAPRTLTPEGFVEVVMRRKALGLTFIKFDLPPRLFEQTPGALVGQATRARIPAVQAVVRPRPRRRRPDQPGRDRALRRRSPAPCARRSATRSRSAPTISAKASAPPTRRSGSARRSSPTTSPGSRTRCPGPTSPATRRSPTRSSPPSPPARTGTPGTASAQAIETRAVDIIHPDMLSSGGLIETKRIADHAERFGIPTALHACCSPVGFMANVHLAAAIASLVAVEHHGLDLPFFRDLVTGLDADYMADGYVAVPDKPGLGVDLNAEEIRRQLREGAEYFADTSDWNSNRVGPEWAPHDD